MTIAQLKERPDLDPAGKLYKLHIQFKEILTEINKKQLPDSFVTALNEDIEQLNAMPDSEELRKATKQKQTALIRQLQKDFKIVSKNYYRSIWTVLGMTLFGLPIGVSIAMSSGNMGFMGIGLPIGMPIGAAIGASMDKKAQQEDRQLDIQVRY